MNNPSKKEDMRDEYDFSAAVRGKHHKDFEKASNVVLLDPDVAEKFKDSDSVNHALRMLINLAGSEVQRNITR